MITFFIIKRISLTIKFLYFLAKSEIGTIHLICCIKGINKTNKIVFIDKIDLNSSI